VSSARQSRLTKRNGVSETNLHDYCNQHGQLLQIQLHSSVARQSRRLSIRPSVEHAPTEIGQTKWRQRDKSAQPLQSTRSVVTNPIAFERRTAIQAIVARRSFEHAPTEIGQTKWRQRDKSAQPLQSTRSVVTNPIAFERRTAIQAIVARRSFLIRAHCCVLRE
jgi:hypothetical protein